MVYSSWLWAQNGIDEIPNEHVTGTLLICECGNSGKSVVYAETDSGHFFYYNSLGSPTIKASFDNSVFVMDIVYYNGYVYFCGTKNWTLGVIGRFDPMMIFGGSDMYDYVEIQNMGTGLDCSIPVVEKLACYTDNGIDYVGFVAQHWIEAFSHPMHTVGCAWHDGQQWNVEYVYNKHENEGFEDIAVIANYVVTVGKSKDGDFNVWAWKKNDSFIRHLLTSAPLYMDPLSPTPLESQICAMYGDEFVVVTKKNSKIYTSWLKISSGAIQSLGFSNYFSGQNVQEVMYCGNADSVLVQYNNSHIARVGTSSPIVVDNINPKAYDFDVWNSTNYISVSRNMGNIYLEYVDMTTQSPCTPSGTNPLGQVHLYILKKLDGDQPITPSLRPNLVTPSVSTIATTNYCR